MLRVNILSEEKEETRITDMIIEESVELYGFIPKEKSDENRKWMIEQVYKLKQDYTNRRGKYRCGGRVL
jgi:hypothetical protein